MPLAAQTPAERVEQLISLNRRLFALVQRQTTLFEEQRVSEAAALRQESDALTRLYAEESAQIAANPALVSSAPQDRRHALHLYTKELEEAVAAHLSTVDALRSLNEGLVQAIAEHVAAVRLRTSNYGPSAVTSHGDAHAAITLDRQA